MTASQQPNLHLLSFFAKILCDANEFAELPVRHNEDELNAELAKDCPLAVPQSAMDSPHTKALLLLQAHFSQ